MTEISGDTVRTKTSCNLLAASLAFAGLVATQPAVSAPLSAPETLVFADAGTPSADIAPMSDAAIQGGACLGAAAGAMGVAYAVGPSELMMIMTGAMHVSSGSAVMFIPMLSILGGVTCAMAASATPAVTWAIEQSDAIGAQFAPRGNGLFGDSSYRVVDTGKDGAARSVRAMTETETQGAGCLVGALSGFGAAMATAPMEVTMLSSGATTVASTTPLLAMGLLATIVTSGCVIGSMSALPITAFISNFGAIGDSIVQAAAGTAQAFANLISGRPDVQMTGPDIQLADSALLPDRQQISLILGVRQ